MSDAPITDDDAVDVEGWCNAFASELLIPRTAIDAAVRQDVALVDDTRRLARRFAVSEAAALRALHDAGHITPTTFRARIGPLVARRAGADKGGGDFYATLLARVSRRFATDLVVGTLEGRIPYTRALGILGMKKVASFDALAQKLGVVV